MQVPRTFDESGELASYKRVEERARARAHEVKKLYLQSVPQAKWLRLDVNGAVLMTPAELSLLPANVQKFFLHGNMSHYKTDRIALRGSDLILLDGHYSGGVAGDLRTDQFLALASRYRIVPTLIASLDDHSIERWKATLALWDILSALAVAQFHALKSASLLSHDERVDVHRAERDMSAMFDGFFNTLLGRPSDLSIGNLSKSIESIIDNISSQKETLVGLSSYDLFRTEREAPGAYSLMGAFSWAMEGKLRNADLAIGLLLGGIDGIEAIRFLDRNQHDLGLSKEHFPRSYQYILPRVKPIGQKTRISGKRTDDCPLLGAQAGFLSRISKNANIVIVDDMATTGATISEIKVILHAQQVTAVKCFVNQVGTRWAINDVAPSEAMESFSAVAVSPTTRAFRGKHLGIEKLLQRLRTHQALEATRRFSHGLEIIPYLKQAKLEGIALGVGLDLFGTLIEDIAYDRDKRRTALHSLWLKRLQGGRHKITAEEFLSAYKRTRQRVEDRARRARGTFAEFRNDEFWLELLLALGVSDPDAVMGEMLYIELEFERRGRHPVPGMQSVVTEAVSLFGAGAVGVFSNSRMPRAHVLALLRAFDFVGDKGPLKEENVLVSSDIGVKKPDPKTIGALCDRLSIPVSKIIFIGNDTADIRAAGRANAVGAQLIPTVVRIQDVQSGVKIDSL
jgi:putative hydrolase of the HAD superfamily